MRKLLRHLRRLRQPTTLAPLDAYAEWAPNYPAHAHNPLMRAEEAAMRPLLPDLQGQRVLDLACGTGRWSRIAGQMGADTIVGIDFSLPMLSRARLAYRAQASLDALPFAAYQFDVAICGLAIGHMTELDGFAQEIARLLTPGGTLLLSHVHPAGTRAGWQREFTASDGRRLAVEHYPHQLPEIRTAFAEHGLHIDQTAEPRMGIEISAAFPGSNRLYRKYHGTPALLIVRARKSQP